MKNKRLYEYSIKRSYVGLYEDSIAYCVNNPEALSKALKITDIHSSDQEHFLVFTLDNKNRIKGFSEITRGLLDRSHIHPREIFKFAVINSASKIIIAHNHPSGELTPSPQDIECTKNIIKCGELMGIPLVDSIICGEYFGQYKSVSIRKMAMVDFK